LFPSDSEGYRVPLNVSVGKPYLEKGSNLLKLTCPERVNYSVTLLLDFFSSPSLPYATPCSASLSLVDSRAWLCVGSQFPFHR
jgi:hypothetical protein